MMDKAGPLLEVRNLCVSYPMKRAGFLQGSGRLQAVKGASFAIEQGSTVGLVGESGSGKSTIGKAILKLIPFDQGTIRYDGVEIGGMSQKEFLPFRKRIQTVFQDPYASLNPRLKVGAIVAEPLIVHRKNLSSSERLDRVAEMLERVGLPTDAMGRYPHQFSGGQRQRICIARALSAEPEFIICDECVSALDVSVQAQIVNLLQDLQTELGITLLFIAHDLAVIEHMSHYVVVMENGAIVEQAPADAFFEAPQTDYARKLLDAVPRMPSIPLIDADARTA